MVAIDRFVELAQELDRGEVLATPVDVRHPLAVLATVVEVEHRRHRVHAQAVDVVALEPRHRGRLEEAAHLVAVVVEDQALPFGVVALARIEVLVEAGPVELGEPVRIVGEMRGHPVEDDADPGSMQNVDEVHEVLRRAVARGRCEVAGGLVTPRAVERMLGDRQKLDVRETVLGRVTGERVRDAAIVRKASLVASPRAQVHLVDRDRRIERVVAGARSHPLAVAPLEVERPGAGRRQWRRFGVHREGIRLVELASVTRRDAVLVRVPVRNIGHRAFPDARAVVTESEWMREWIPAVPLADEGDARSIGRPDAKGRRRCAQVASHHSEQPAVRSFAEQIDVLLAERRRERRRR